MPVIVPNPAPGLGYGGAEYGYSPYGSGGVARQPWTVTGGYGGYRYGYRSYGSVDITPPRVSSAASIDGYTVEVFFSEAMAITAALTSAVTYTLTPTIGAASTVLSVALGTQEDGGATSVILTHTGTTLGGNYTVTVAGTLEDVVGNPILTTARTAGFLALGATPTYTATPTSGNQVVLSFSEDLLTEADFSPGVSSLASYGFETTYPVPLTATAVEHPLLADASQVRLTVPGMTSATYDVTVSPATAFDYDGSYLPSAATTFTGVATGTGTSTAGATGLLLSKAAGVAYGWDFQDTSGKMLPASTYRVDVEIDASAAVYAPALYDAVLGSITVSDGAVQATITLTRVAGVAVLEVTSGAYFAQVPAAWNAGPCTISLLRNQKGGHYSLLFDGVPLATSAVAGYTGVPSIAPGVRFQLATTYGVTQFPVRSVGLSSSQTVFSASWNFLHGVTYSFVGSTALTRPSLLTRRGPLVKDWGDSTPATVQDVAVRVNGVDVEVGAVNPYLGLVTPTIPIPLTAPGTTSVDVDYVWFPNPVFPMVGINTPGLVLNKWQHHQGWHPPAENPLPSTSLGVPDRMRFPMGVVLPPLVRQRPVLVGHRYIGFEKAYTAALNSPTTLLLNQNPHRVARDVLSATPEDVQVSYEGTVVPTDADDPWALTGADAGHVGTGSVAGYYVLIDDSSGTYGTGQAALYVRDEDLSFPATAGMAVRLQGVSWTSDGVFTGLGFGFHDDHRLFLVGLLEVNGVKHVGLIKNPLRPDLVASWTIGPSVPITITSSNTFTTTSSAFTAAALEDAGVTFQVLAGTQAGVYTVASCGISVDGDTATVTINETFPANHKLYGNDTATAYLETAWDEDPITLRLVAQTEAGSAQVYVGGALSGLAVSSSKVPAYPAETTLLLPTTKEGAFFWGSVSRVATNESRWGFARYGLTYDRATFHFQGIVVAAEMGVTPDLDPNHEWFVTEDFGYAEVDSSGDTLLLKSTTASASAVLDTTFGYARLEPFLTSRTLVDVDATFRVDSGILGAGDAQVRVQNGDRSVVLSTILYAEGVSRQLVTLPSVCITALRDPVDDGWAESLTGLVTVEPRENLLVVTQDTGGSVRFSSALVLTPESGHGRIAEGRFAVTSAATLGVGDGPVFGFGVGPLGRDVGLQLLTGPARVQLVSNGAAVGAATAFAWDDAAQHTYRLVADPTANTVVLVVDDQVLATVALTSFAATGSSTAAYFGAQNTSVANRAAVAEWESFSVVPLPVAAVKRTLGVRRSGGDPDDIDGWVLPRTDALDVPNSDLAAVVEEMDWRSDVQVRVRLDPGWGCTVFRPDLPPPPYFDGEFATQYTEPSAGWINVEYRHLPRLTDIQKFGKVAFGSLDPRSISQQRWYEVRYRIYTRGDEDFISPQHMVLNWHNVITSGEFLRDTGAEVVQVEALTATLVSLAPSHIRADRVFNVVVGATVLGPDKWSFDRDAQAVTLTTPLPSEHELVTVSFAPGKPVTNTYLCTQPLLQSTTLLNEGTPPVPKSQVGTATRQVVFGSKINDPTDTLGDVDFILNDPFRTVAFTDDSDVLYEALEFCEADDGNTKGLIAIACDGPAPEVGWVELALSGTSFSEGFSREGGPARWGGSNIAADTVGGFSQNSVLHASGRGFDGGHIGPGTAILYPSYPAVPGPDAGATGRAMHWFMRMSSAFYAHEEPAVGGGTVVVFGEADLADDMAIADTASDNTPASAAGDDVDPNPDGVPAPSGNGAAVGKVVDYDPAQYSRIGPWAGETALAVMSQLAGNGLPASGTAFTLVGGAPLGPDPAPSTLNIVAP